MSTQNSKASNAMLSDLGERSPFVPSPMAATDPHGSRNIYEINREDAKGAKPEEVLKIE